MKKTVVLGNIITVDDKRPFAKAVFVKDGVCKRHQCEDAGDAGD